MCCVTNCWPRISANLEVETFPIESRFGSSRGATELQLVQFLLSRRSHSGDVCRKKRAPTIGCKLNPGSWAAAGWTLLLFHPSPRPSAASINFGWLCLAVRRHHAQRATFNELDVRVTAPSLSQIKLQSSDPVRRDKPTALHAVPGCRRQGTSRYREPEGL
jgi:hypothetical protein